jgi:hypothetical protein
MLDEFVVVLQSQQCALFFFQVFGLSEGVLEMVGVRCLRRLLGQVVHHEVGHERDRRLVLLGVQSREELLHAVGHS